MDKILCRVEPGLGQHRIYYYQDDVLKITKEVDYVDLADYLINLCHYNLCFNLYLSGSPIFLQGLIEEIQTKEVTEYSNNKIQIEVI